MSSSSAKEFNQRFADQIAWLSEAEPNRASAWANCRVKVSPVDGTINQVMVFSSPIFKDSRFPGVTKFRNHHDEQSDMDVFVSEFLDDAAGDDKGTDGPARAFRRARAQCFDFLMCNDDLDTFVTFTVDEKECDRYSYDDIVKYLSVWLDNRVRRRGLKYILVPERHKDGAIHFHGVMNRQALSLVDSGMWKRGKYNVKPDGKLRPGDKIIYNVLDLHLGFSTAIDIGGEDARIKVSKYIWKYMGKQGMQKIGGRYYLHGGDMRAPIYHFFNVNIDEIGGTPFEIATGLSCKLFSL